MTPSLRLAVLVLLPLCFTPWTFHIPILHTLLATPLVRGKYVTLAPLWISYDLFCIGCLRKKQVSQVQKFAVKIILAVGSMVVLVCSFDERDIRACLDGGCGHRVMLPLESYQRARLETCGIRVDPLEGAAGGPKPSR